MIGVEADADALATGRGHVERSTQRAVDRGKLSGGERDAILGRITLTTSREDLREADLVVEAIPEVLDYKRSLFADLDRICKPETVLATNTSSLPVTAIAAATGRQGRGDRHALLQPRAGDAPGRGRQHGADRSRVVPEISGLARRLGKTPVAVGDRAGFVVNRLLLRLSQPGRRAPGAGPRRAGGHRRGDAARLRLPMGPFALLDLIGLDTAYEVMGVMFDETRDRRHAPAPLLRELVSARLLGRKSGRGFHGDEPRPREPDRSTVITFEMAGRGPTS